MAVARSVVVQVASNLFVAYVAKQHLASRAVHLVLSALLGINCLARRTFDTPLDVYKWISVETEVLLNHLEINRRR